MNTPFILASQATAALSALTCIPITWLGNGHLRIGSHTFPASEHLPTSAATIFLTSYLPPDQALALRQQGCYYLDSAGNAFVHKADFYLLIEGKTLAPPTTPATPPPVRSRLLFYLLSQPELLQASYREIATSVGVSLGSVSAFFTELSQQGLVQEKPIRREMDTTLLLARWLQDYDQTLRPTLGVQRYRWASAPGTRWKQLPMGTGAYWSGESAARQLLQEKHSSPTRFTLYSDSLPAWGLVPDPVAGPLEILAPPFPLPKLAGTNGLAHPLLVYTDLRLSERAFDQGLAQEVRARYLAHLL